LPTIVKTPTGKWKALIRRKGWPTTSKTFRVKRDAEDWARSIEDEMVRRLYVNRAPAERITVREALERYLEEITPTKKLSTQAGERRKAKDWVGKGGRARTLRKARVTDRNLYEVATVVCVHDKAMKEPWCLVASDSEASAKELKNHYAQRWGIETSFRDIKDMRFGMGMSQLRISNPARRDRLLLISALAMALLTVLGATGEALGYDRMLKANTVKRRTHSLFRQGCMLYDWLPRMPEKYFAPLLRAFADNLRQHEALAIVFALPAK